MVNASNDIRIKISKESIITAFKEMRQREKEAFLEDLIALASPKYLDSIRQARSDYKAGRIKTH